MSELEKHLEMKEIVQVPIFEESKKEIIEETFIIKETDPPPSPVASSSWGRAPTSLRPAA